jgi:hypothetical protein
MYVTLTTIRFAAVTAHTQQLNIVSIAATATRKRCYMVVLQTIGTAAALAYPSISGKNNFFGCSGNIPALRKAA